MFHHSLVSFYIALQYCLSVSVLVCVLFVPTLGPMGAGRSPLGLLLLPFHSRFWALTLKPKRRRRKTKNANKRRRKIFQQCNSLCFVSIYTLKYTLSRLLMMIYQNSIYNPKGQRVLVYREHCVCVCSDMQEGRIMGTRQGREPNRVSLNLCACSAVTEGIIA